MLHHYIFAMNHTYKLFSFRQVKPDIIINEIQIMKESHHHAIVNYIDSYIVEGTLWVVMELITGGSLAELIEVKPCLSCADRARVAQRDFRFARR